MFMAGINCVFIVCLLKKTRTHVELKIHLAERDMVEIVEEERGLRVSMNRWVTVRRKNMVDGWISPQFNGLVLVVLPSTP